MGVKSVLANMQEDESEIVNEKGLGTRSQWLKYGTVHSVSLGGPRFCLF